MIRDFKPHGERTVSRFRRRQKERALKFLFEVLEDRTMLDSGGLPAAIVLGRTLATPSTADTSTPSPSYFAGEVENNQVTITITAYNEQADDETGVLITDTLIPGETLVSASPQPDQEGQKLAWSMGTIQGFDRASVTLTVSLSPTTPLQLDGGARVFAMLDAGAVSNTTPAATLSAGSLSGPSLLARTPDANTTDPFIQEEAAKLDYDPQAIYDFLQSEVGYNSYVGSFRAASRHALEHGRQCARRVQSRHRADAGLGNPGAVRPGNALAGTGTAAHQLDVSNLIIKALGAIAPGLTTADPANDPTLLAETTQHYWFQFDTGSGMRDADPIIARSDGRPGAHDVDRDVRRGAG